MGMKNWEKWIWGGYAKNVNRAGMGMRIGITRPIPVPALYLNFL